MNKTVGDKTFFLNKYSKTSNVYLCPHQELGFNCNQPNQTSAGPQPLSLSFSKDRCTVVIKKTLSKKKLITPKLKQGKWLVFYLFFMFKTLITEVYSNTLTTHCFFVF